MTKATGSGARTRPGFAHVRRQLERLAEDARGLPTAKADRERLNAALRTVKRRTESAEERLRELSGPNLRLLLEGLAAGLVEALERRCVPLPVQERAALLAAAAARLADPSGLERVVSALLPAPDAEPGAQPDVEPGAEFGTEPGSGVEVPADPSAASAALPDAPRDVSASGSA